MTQGFELIVQDSAELPLLTVLSFSRRNVVSHPQVDSCVLVVSRRLVANSPLRCLVSAAQRRAALQPQAGVKGAFSSLGCLRIGVNE